MNRQSRRRIAAIIGGGLTASALAAPAIIMPERPALVRADGSELRNKPEIHKAMLPGLGGIMAGVGGASALSVSSVFAATAYTGNNTPRLITTGLAMSTAGGMVWTKARSSGGTNHHLWDSARGVTNALSSNSTGAEGSHTTQGVTAFNTNGFTLGDDGGGNGYNNAGVDTIAWSFLKAAGFFDIVTYTGTGSIHTIPHNLGVAPGFIVTKRRNSTGGWVAYHRSMNGASPEQGYLYLNGTNAFANVGGVVWNAQPTSSVFSVDTDGEVNTSGGTYVAYSFAHDTSPGGIIQCGTFSQSSAANVDINLGWQPQFVLQKRLDAVGQWNMIDATRGFNAPSTPSNVLRANLTNAESTIDLYVLANGYRWPAAQYGSGTESYIYMAIRAP